LFTEPKTTDKCPLLLIQAMPSRWQIQAPGATPFVRLMGGMCCVGSISRGDSLVGKTGHYFNILKGLFALHMGRVFTGTQQLKNILMDRAVFKKCFFDESPIAVGIGGARRNCAPHK
jgi:hypothetical protein